MKKILVGLFIFLPGILLAQEGLHLGFSIGPNKTIVQKELNPIYPPNSSFKGRVSLAEALFIEYGFNSHISIKLNIRNASYGFNVKFKDLNGVTSSGIQYSGGQNHYWGYNYLHYEIALGLRIPLIYEKLFLFQNTGLVYLPTANIYQEIQEDGFYLTGKGTYHTTIYSFNKRNTFGLNAGLGLELRVGKKNYLSLGVFDYHGFKPISYTVDKTNYNGQTYSNTLISNGSYITLQVGFKRNISFPKEKKKIRRMKMEDDKADSLTNRSKQPNSVPISDSSKLFMKGNKCIGASYRIIDRNAIYVPGLTGICIMPRFLFFVKDKFALGPIFYFKYLNYASTSKHELMGGLTTRKYFGNSKNKIAASIDLLIGSIDLKTSHYKTYSTSFVTAFVPGVGFNRLVSKKISIESFVKYMYINSPKAFNNIFWDFGFNYHF